MHAIFILDKMDPIVLDPATPGNQYASNYGYDEDWNSNSERYAQDDG